MCWELPAVKRFLCANGLKRDKLWAIKAYGCIAKFRFLNLNFASDPQYRTALKRLKKPGSTDTFLDLACCVGQVLRKVAFDGVDSSRLYGTDLEQGFIDLGYELFRDRGKLKATVVVGDVLKGDGDGRDEDERLKVLDGKITIIHSQSFFHLFSWDLQVKAAKRIIRFLKPNDPNVMIFGRQVGSSEPGNDITMRGTTRFLHNAESWQRLWDEVGEQTGTKWKTMIEVADLPRDIISKMFAPYFKLDGNNRISFGVYRA